MSVDLGEGEVETGWIDATNLEGGILPNTTIGFYTQVVPANDGDSIQRTADPNEWITATFSNVDFHNEIPGDFNGDGVVNGDDFLVWQQGFGTIYDGDDFLIWQQNFNPGSGSVGTAVPEPASAVLALLGACLITMLSRRRR
jgi:hypothetical protein